MKRTITATLKDLRSGQLANKLSLGHDNCTINITYDDGKPNTWEWMWRAGASGWQIGGSLFDEAEAKEAYGEGQHKKLREFQVEVEGE